MELFLQWKVGQSVHSTVSQVMAATDRTRAVNMTNKRIQQTNQALIVVPQDQESEDDAGNHAPALS